MLAGRGGVCLFLSLLRGGTGGVSDNKSGSALDPTASPSPEDEIYGVMYRYVHHTLRGSFYRDRIESKRQTKHRSSSKRFTTLKFS